MQIFKQNLKILNILLFKKIKNLSNSIFLWDKLINKRRSAFQALRDEKNDTRIKHEEKIWIQTKTLQ